MFDYDNAFSRNIGWVTTEEQNIIRSTTIAIAGLGGAGGEHVLTLARMGFEKFKLSDFDEFEVHNFNRQAGAYVSTVGRPKCEVMAEMLKDINPNAQVETYPNGINKGNVEAFLQDVDVYVDGVDFFAMEARETLYQKLEELGIPNFLAAPLGMGVAMICFKPGSMGFDQYYRFSESKTDEEKFIKLLIGLSPALLHSKYLADQDAANFKEKRGPSTPMAIKLCSGLLVSNVVKLVLNRGGVVCAPKVLQFDAYRNKFVTSWCPFGNGGIGQRIKYQIIKKIVS